MSELVSRLGCSKVHPGSRGDEHCVRLREDSKTLHERSRTTGGGVSQGPHPPALQVASEESLTDLCIVGTRRGGC